MSQSANMSAMLSWVIRLAGSDKNSVCFYDSGGDYSCIWAATRCFFRQIGEKIVHGEVKEKKAAKETYDKAKRQGQSAGHVFQK